MPTFDELIADFYDKQLSLVDSAVDTSAVPLPFTVVGEDPNPALRALIADFYDKQLPLVETAVDTPAVRPTVTPVVETAVDTPAVRPTVTPVADTPAVDTTAVDTPVAAGADDPWRMGMPTPPVGPPDIGERAIRNVVSSVVGLPKTFLDFTAAAATRQQLRKAGRPVGTSVLGSAADDHQKSRYAQRIDRVNKEVLKAFHDNVIATGRVGTSTYYDHEGVKRTEEHTMLLSTADFDIGGERKTYIIPYYNPETGRKISFRSPEEIPLQAKWREKAERGEIQGYDSVLEAEAALQTIRSEIIPEEPGYLESVGGAVDVAMDPTAAFRGLFTGDSRPFHEWVSEELIGMLGPRAAQELATSGSEWFEDAQRIIERRMSEDEENRLATLLQPKADPLGGAVDPATPITLSKKNHNPGNLKEGSPVSEALALKNPDGTPQTDKHRHLIFPNDKAGWKALRLDVEAKLTPGGSAHAPRKGGAFETLGELGKVFPKEAGKNIGNWAKGVTSILRTDHGVDARDMKLQDIPFDALIASIAKQEGWKPDPASSPASLTTAEREELEELIKKKANVPPDYSENELIDNALNPEWYIDSLSKQGGNVISFIALMRLGARMGGLPGAAGLATVYSGILEAASHYAQRRNEVPEHQAAAEAAQVAKVAGPITGLMMTGPLGALATGAGRTLQKFAGAMVSEVPEEMAQNLTSNAIAGRPLFEGMGETALLAFPMGFFQAGGVLRSSAETQMFKSRFYNQLEKAPASAIRPIIEARNADDLTVGQQDVMDNLVSPEEGSTYSETVIKMAKNLGIEVPVGATTVEIEEAIAEVEAGPTAAQVEEAIAEAEAGPTAAQVEEALPTTDDTPRTGQPLVEIEGDLPLELELIPGIDDVRDAAEAEEVVEPSRPLERTVEPALPVVVQEENLEEKYDAPAKNLLKGNTQAQLLKDAVELDITTVRKKWNKPQILDEIQRVVKERRDAETAALSGLTAEAEAPVAEAAVAEAEAEAPVAPVTGKLSLKRRGDARAAGAFGEFIPSETGSYDITDASGGIVGSVEQLPASGDKAAFWSALFDEGPNKVSISRRRFNDVRQLFRENTAEQLREDAELEQALLKPEAPVAEAAEAEAEAPVAEAAEAEAELEQALASLLEPEAPVAEAAEAEVDETSIEPEFGSPIQVRATTGGMKELGRIDDTGQLRRKASDSRDNDTVYLFDSETDNFFVLDDESDRVEYLDEQGVVDFWDGQKRMPVEVYKRYLEGNTFTVAGENVRVTTPSRTDGTMDLERLTFENLDTGEVTEANDFFKVFLPISRKEHLLNVQPLEEAPQEGATQRDAEFEKWMDQDLGVGPVLDYEKNLAVFPDDLDVQTPAIKVGAISPEFLDVLADGQRLVDAVAVGDTDTASLLANKLDELFSSRKASIAWMTKIRQGVEERFSDPSYTMEQLRDAAGELADHVEPEDDASFLLRHIMNMELADAVSVSSDLASDYPSEAVISAMAQPAREISDNEALENPEWESMAQQEAADEGISVSMARSRVLDRELGKENYGPGAANKAEFERRQELSDALDQMNDDNVAEDDPGRLALQEELKKLGEEPLRTAPPTNDIVKSVNEGAAERIQRAHMSVERRFEPARQVKEAFDWVRQKMTREYYHLPRTDTRFSELRNVLRVLMHSRTITDWKIYKDLREVVEELSQEDYDIFVQTVLFRDLRNDVDPPVDKEGKKQEPRFPVDSEGKGAFGLTPENVLVIAKRFDDLVAARPDVERALEKRKVMWDKVRKDYFERMSEIGLEFSAEWTNEDYFRHQILQYSRAKAEVLGTHEVSVQGVERALSRGAEAKVGQRPSAPGRRLDPRKTGIHKARRGSLLDYNTNYLEAEWDALSQMAANMEIAKVLIHVKDTFDIKLKIQGELDFDRKTQIETLMQTEGLEKTDASNKVPRESWMDHLPDGYAAYSPAEGNSIFMANSIPEQLAIKLIEAKAQGKGYELAEEQVVVSKVMALGSARAQWNAMAVPVEVRETLLNLAKGGPASGYLDSATKRTVSLWKRNMLLAPSRVLRWSARNMLGDAEITFVGNPAGFKYAPEAMAELYDFMYRDKDMTPELKDWFERGGFGGLISVSELGDVNMLPGLDNLVPETTSGETLEEKMKNFDFRVFASKAKRNTWDLWWKKTRMASDYREAILRYANYKSFIRQIEQSGTGKPKSYAASIREDVDALKDPKDRAFKLANELMGAYDQVSEGGQALKQGLAPFWSFAETNFTRFKRLTQNAVLEGNTSSWGGQPAAIAGHLAKRVPYKAYRLLMFYGKAHLAWSSMLAVWNYLMANEEDKLVPAHVREGPHITFPNLFGDENRVSWLDRFSVSDEVMGWFGLADLPSHISDVASGKRTVWEVATESGKNVVNKVTQIAPAVQLFNLLQGFHSFPDIFKPYGVKDIPSEVLEFTGIPGLAPFYKIATKIPILPLEEQLSNIFAYSTDVREAGYNNTQAAKYKWMEGRGDEGSAIYRMTPRELTLYYAKLAIEYGDEASAVDYLKQWTAFTDKEGTRLSTLEGLKKSFDKMDPLSGLSEGDKLDFVRSLDPQQMADLAMGMRWYREVVIGKGIGDIVEANIEWMGDAFEAREFNLLLKQLHGEALAQAYFEQMGTKAEGAPSAESLYKNYNEILKSLGGWEGLLERGLTPKELSEVRNKTNREIKRTMVKELTRQTIKDMVKVDLPFVSSL